MENGRSSWKSDVLGVDEEVVLGQPPDEDGEKGDDEDEDDGEAAEAAARALLFLVLAGDPFVSIGSVLVK